MSYNGHERPFRRRFPYVFVGLIVAGVAYLSLH
jgi:hypothetical protein